MNECSETESACNAVPECGPGIEYPPPTPYYGALIGQDVSDAEMEKRRRDERTRQAVYVLQQAREIRADIALMTDVRLYIRRLRDEGAALLDDLG